MDIEASLKGETAQKICFLQEETDLDVEDVIKNAIDVYYEQTINKGKAPLDIFTELNLIGCFDGNKDLSINSEKHLRDILDEKYNNH